MDAEIRQGRIQRMQHVRPIMYDARLISLRNTSGSLPRRPTCPNPFRLARDRLAPGDSQAKLPTGSPRYITAERRQTNYLTRPSAPVPFRRTSPTTFGPRWRSDPRPLAIDLEGQLAIPACATGRASRQRILTRGSTWDILPHTQTGTHIPTKSTTMEDRTIEHQPAQLK